MSIYEELYSAEKSGKSIALCVITRTTGTTPRHTGSKMIVFRDGRIIGSIGGGYLEQICVKDAIQAIDEKKPTTKVYNIDTTASSVDQKDTNWIEVFIDPIKVKSTIIIIGAGHVGKQVAFLAKWLGYRVVVIDDRSSLCNEKNIPEADEHIVGDVREVITQFPIDTNTLFVLATRNSEIDAEILPIILNSNTSYIGVLGSKTRWKATKEALKSSGIEESDLLRINSPIGVDISAETPEEIAISIMGQIIKNNTINMRTINNVGSLLSSQ